MFECDYCRSCFSGFIAGNVSSFFAVNVSLFLLQVMFYYF